MTHKELKTESFESNQHRFLKNHYKQHRQVTLARILLLISFLGIWEFCAYKKIIDSFFFSSPSQVVSCFLEMLYDWSFFIHTGVTLFETLISFLLVFFISMLSATLLWFSNRLSKILEPYLVILNNLPKSALAPLFIVWLGTGITTIIIAGISVALFGSIISLYTGFKQVDENKLRLIYTLGGNRLDAFTKVVLPSCIPNILSSVC